MTPENVLMQHPGECSAALSGFQKNSIVYLGSTMSPSVAHGAKGNSFRLYPKDAQDDGIVAVSVYPENLRGRSGRRSSSDWTGYFLFVQRQEDVISVELLTPWEPPVPAQVHSTYIRACIDGAWFTTNSHPGTRQLGDRYVANPDLICAYLYAASKENAREVRAAATEVEEEISARQQLKNLEIVLRGQKDDRKAEIAKLRALIKEVRDWYEKLATSGEFLKGLGFLLLQSSMRGLETLLGKNQSGEIDT